MSFLAASLDRVDYAIIQRLLEDGRASFSAIARDTKLTDVAIKKRVERLKRRGIISSISANLNYKTLGFENPIFVQMRTELGKNKDIIKKLHSLDFVVELNQTIGEFNLLAKIIVPSMDSADKYLDRLGVLDGVLEVKTSVVLSELKKSSSLPPTTLQKKL